MSKFECAPARGRLVVTVGVGLQLTTAHTAAMVTTIHSG